MTDTPDGASGARRARAPFTVMAKPIGPQCNLDCRYCYYTEKQRLYPRGAGLRMSDETLAAFVRDYMACQEGPEITFVWQGGEPTLLGLAFFERVVELQRRHRPAGTIVRNALQTNGILLDRSWARFLRAHGFLVGLSVDGPRALHDRYRVTKKGAPTFDAVLGALRLLRDEGVAFNTLTVVHRHNAAHGRAIYRFLRGEGGRYMQFIPLVERHRTDGALAAPRSGGRPGPATVRPRQMGGPAARLPPLRVSLRLQRRMPETPLRANGGRRSRAELSLPVLQALLRPYRAHHAPHGRAWRAHPNAMKNGWPVPPESTTTATSSNDSGSSSRSGGLSPRATKRSLHPLWVFSTAMVTASVKAAKRFPLPVFEAA